MSQKKTQPLREKKGRIDHVSITYYYVQVDWNIGDDTSDQGCLSQS